MLLSYFSVFTQPEPKILYNLKAVGGSLTAIPGISDMIDVSYLQYSNFFKQLNLYLFVICFGILR